MLFDKDRRVETRMVVNGWWTRACVVAGMASLMVMMVSGPVEAQTSSMEMGQASGVSQPLTVSVQEVSQSSRRMTVTMNKSLIVDTSLPVRRASVTAPSVAEVVVLSPTKLLVTGKSFGATQLILWTDDQQQELFDLLVVLDLRELEAAIKETSPHSQINLRPMMGTLVVSGGVPDAETAERVMQLASIYTENVHNQLQVYGSQQVVIRCTMAEVSKSAMRRLGVNGWLAGDNFQDMFAVSQIGGVNPANIGGAAGASAVGRIPFLTGGNGIPLLDSTTFSLGFPTVQAQVFIQALRENGLMRILAEPTMMTLSGETASFLAGGEFPIPVPQGNQNVTIEYKVYGVRLNFTPTVLAGQQIRMKVAPEVSELDFSSAVQISGVTVPGLTQRRAETTIVVGSGQTVALAGLLSENVRGVSSKLPGLGDLPVLGQLFRSVEFEKNQTELVIMVTPDLAGAMNPDQVAALPGDDLTVPSDYELFGKGHLVGKPASPARGDMVESAARPAKPGSVAQDDPAWIGTWGFADNQEAN